MVVKVLAGLLLFRSCSLVGHTSGLDNCCRPAEVSEVPVQVTSFSQVLPCTQTYSSLTTAAEISPVLTSAVLDLFFMESGSIY